MERRINKRVNEFITNFKEDIRGLVLTCQDNINDSMDAWDGEDMETMNTIKASVSSELMLILQQVYDHQNITLQKEDFAKRKRVKNIVPFFDRCVACRANRNSKFKTTSGNASFKSQFRAPN